MRPRRSSPRPPDPTAPGGSDTPAGRRSRWRLPPPGWRRAVALRRIGAGVLLVVAAVLALGGGAAPTGTEVVVAVRDLGPGAPVAPVDVALRSWPDELVPTGTLVDPGVVAGRVLVGGVRAGEPLTDVRLLGPQAARASAGRPDAAGVPLRLADPGIGGLLHPGVRVDVVAVAGGPGGRPGGEAGGEDVDAGVVAAGAVVLAVLPPSERTATGPVVVVALPAPEAARVAATSLSREVTVTLR